MTWQIRYTPQHPKHREACLTLQNNKKHYKLRGWYGPLAELIFKNIQKYLPIKKQQPIQQQTIEKQLAQFILIQASFLHQRCLHDYQITTDTEKAGLAKHHDLADLLLFIRMTANHPCYDSIMTLFDTQIPWCEDIDTQLNMLLECKIIQQLRFQNWHFFDKNPFPHNHVLDLQKQMLFDYHQLHSIVDHKKLIVGTSINHPGSILYIKEPSSSSC